VSADIAVPTRRPRTHRIADRLAGGGMLLFLPLLIAYAQVTYPRFLEPANLQNILSQNAPIGLIAMGMTFVMIGGGFDLSVGAIVAVASVAYARLALAMPLWPAMALTIVLGIGLGLANGVLVTWLRLNPFVATLATASVFSGAAYVLSDSEPIVVDVPSFQGIGQGTVGGLPVSVLLLAAAMVLGGVVLAYSVYGHGLYATGGNREAARLAGLRVDRTRIVTYVTVGAMAALAGVVLTSRLGVGQADIGADLTLNVITIVVIGGTSLFGGEGAMWRTAVGLVLLGVIANVADSKGWSGSVQDIVKGAILLGAVGMDVVARQLRPGASS